MGTDLTITYIMKLIKIISILAVAAGSYALSSCTPGCCTGEDSVPPLRPLPDFKPLDVDYSK